MSQLPAFVVVGVVLSREICELVVEVLELLQAKEVEGDGRAAAAGVLTRDEHVHLRIRTVPHVVDGGDLGTQVIEVAPATVKKDP